MHESNSTQLIALVIGLVLAVAFIIGLIVTPYVHGQPLLLTSENRVVKDYLDAYAQRLTAAEKEQTSLLLLLSPTRPGASSSSVFDLSQKARVAQANLDALATAIDQTRVPGGLAPLDQALRIALAAELDLADKTLTFVGRGDEVTHAEASAAGEIAKGAIVAARQALQNTLR